MYLELNSIDFNAIDFNFLFYFLCTFRYLFKIEKVVAMLIGAFDFKRLSQSKRSSDRIISLRGVFTLLGLIFLLASCQDDNLAPSIQGSYITINGISTRANNGTWNGDPGKVNDNFISSLRILAFDAASKECVSNEVYIGAAVPGDGGTIRHEIKQGKFNFIFLVNEPPYNDVKVTLDAIDDYDDIKAIAYKAEYFNSNMPIPMIAENNGVEILANGVIKVNENSVANNILEVNLRRLAARLDVALTAKEGLNLNGIFKGITLSNLPDKVPLVWGLPSDEYKQGSDYEDPDPTMAYTGTIGTTSREFTLENNSEYFTDISSGDTWGRNVNRIIIPSKYLSDTSIENDGITFTANLEDLYNPSCNLKIYSASESGSSGDNYSLPANSRLYLTAVIKEPLEMNIQPLAWTEENDDWKLPVRILNLSQTNVKITDINGARITFTSNMPVVRVMPTIKETAYGTKDTNFFFNSLVDCRQYQEGLDADRAKPERFFYEYDANTKMGTGYMDLLADGGMYAPDDASVDLDGVYTLYLSAENEDGSNALQREIKVEIEQLGTRYITERTTGYVGAFFRNDEMGERIISNQGRLSYATENTDPFNYAAKWSAEVSYDPDGFIVLSSTPSFDPGVGTDNPGDAEDYPVQPNSLKGEGGTSVTGKGRIYFRIGAATKNTNSTPRYGVVKITYSPYGWGDIDTYIYVRQGEEADYLYSTTETVAEAPLAGKTRTSAKAFSPYNLTADLNNSYVKVQNASGERAKEVDFPTQAGAFFQWGTLDRIPYINGGHKGNFYNAYTPCADYNPPWTTPTLYSGGVFQPWLWDADWVSAVMELKKFGWTTLGAASPAAPIGIGGDYILENYYEVCPAGYRRPTDGDTDDYLNARNGLYPNMVNASNAIVNYGAQAVSQVDYSSQIIDSEWRVSLFKTPKGGNGANGENPAEYTATDTDLLSGGSPLVVPEEAVTTQDTYLDTDDSARNWQVGFYADGFYDRRPINGSTKGVSIDNDNVAYRGTLFYHPTTYKSIFFPAAGRRTYDKGQVQAQGETGYYWSSTPAPPTSVDVYGGVWSMQLAFNPNPTSCTHNYGNSIRCVKMTNP